MLDVWRGCDIQDPVKRRESPRVPPKLEVGPSGWVQVLDTAGFVALVRFYLGDDGRLRPNGLLLETQDGDLDMRGLRSFPLLDVQAVANLPEIAPDIVARLGEETTVSVEGATSSEQYRSTTRRTRRPVGTLRIPDSRGRYPDTFYQQVATH